MYAVREIDDNEAHADEELAARLVHNPANKHRRRYFVLDDKEAVACFAIDLEPFALYEVYVRRAYRKRGIGEWVLDRIDIIARALGVSVIYVYPRPLSQEVAASTLRLWYMNRGFVTSTTMPGMLERQISRLDLPRS